ncbi:MAG: DUF3375 domain-containing protein [Bacteroidota bacterium]
MDLESLGSLYDSSEAWRLVRARRAPLILAFLHRQFKAEEVPTRPAVEVEGALVDFLEFYYTDELPPEEDEEENEPDLPRQAHLRIEKWIREGWLRRIPDEAGNDWLELTPETEKALAFVQELQAREFIGTESRLQDIFAKLRDIVSGSQEDPNSKIRELKGQIKHLQSQIRDIQRTGRVEAFSDTQIKERFHEVNRTAKGLLSDFRGVEKIFKQIVRDIYDRQAELVHKRGELLGFALDQIESLRENDQGRSFYAFWEYLIDDRKQDELRELVMAVFDLLRERDIPIHDRLLANIRRFLYQNGQKVFDSNQLLAEKLNRIVAEQNLRERKRALALIDAIRKAARDRRDDPPSDAAFAQVEETVEVSFPLERPLGQAPVRPVTPPVPQAATERLDQADLSHLVDQFFVDQAALRKRIRTLLRDRSQISLEEILEIHPVEQGLAEIMAYFSIASVDRHNYVDPDARFSVHLPGPPAASLELPRVIFTK